MARIAPSRSPVHPLTRSPAHPHTHTPTHPHAHTWLPALLLAAALLTAGVRPVEARVISRSAEISLGRETASQVEQFYSVDRDPVAVARVRGIGRRLAACVENAPYPFEFHVVEDGTINAFALPGGYIYIFRGLLQLLPNDDALASVLAHEIAHVTERHAVKQFEKNLLLNAGLSAILAGAGAGGGFRNAAGVVSALASISFTRGDEADADANGIALMAKAGYDPRAASQAMQAIKRAAGDGKGTPTLLRTHPAPSDRIKKLDTRAEALAAERQKERAAAKPVPPPPSSSARRLPGLDRLEVAPCVWLPLAPGNRWTYRMTRDGAAATMTVQALERVAAEPEGVYRVEYDFSRGIRTVRLLAPAGDRYASALEAAGDQEEGWSVEAVFAPGERVSTPRGIIRFAGVEKVRVPAGEFDTVRVERVGTDGKPESTAWYAKDVGLVKRLSTLGTAQELVGFYFPK